MEMLDVISNFPMPFNLRAKLFDRKNCKDITYDMAFMSKKAKF